MDVLIASGGLALFGFFVTAIVDYTMGEITTESSQTKQEIIELARELNEQDSRLYDDFLGHITDDEYDRAFQAEIDSRKATTKSLREVVIHGVVLVVYVLTPFVL